ncbi:MAG TPA: DUF998 domain-containing protein [Candidatus Saccharimonadales bacterium]|nr:DUF998 domain-containing protein [Candidatus Saccharimonadales bacterium]
MQHIERVKQPARRNTAIGVWLFASSIQFYLAQWYVAARFIGHFSLSQNTISDLGNNACGTYMERVVCSPAHPVMNLSFVILGVTTMLGAISLYLSKSRSNRTSLYGLGCFVVAGMGIAILGFFPENNPTGWHLRGAQMHAFVGNLGLVLLGLFASFLSKHWRYFTVALGIFALVAVYFFVRHNYLDLGIGGMERLGAYPLSIWMTAYGIFELRRLHKNPGTNDFHEDRVGNAG